MRLRKIEKRGARGANKLGLKMGKSSIRALSNEELDALLLRTRKNILKGESPKSFSGNHRRYKDLKRIIRLIRKTDEDGNRLPAYNRKECSWLDSIYPKREEKWLERQKRKKSPRIELKNFSFIDNPIGTFNLLKSIVEAEAQSKFSHIDFLDDRCLDIAPYLVLGLMHKNLTKGVFMGGKVSGPISDVMHAVDLLDLYHVKKMNKANCAYIFPFKIRSRRKTGTSQNDNLPHSGTTEEKASEHFVETFNDWLGKLLIPLELTEEAYIDIGTLFGELLENAKRHSDPINSDGEWHIAGFMEAIPGSDPSDPGEGAKYVCHFSIVNPGCTIYESMQSAPENIKGDVLRYVQNWSQKDAEDKTEAYWSLCAIQDGISRIHPTPDNPKNGFGIMHSLVSLMNAFGGTDIATQEPVMTIISGNSCIMAKYPYNRYTEVDGKRILAFNDYNELDKPPHDDHVLSMPGRFPGTLITVRFVMDNNHLMKMVKESPDNGK